MNLVLLGMYPVARLDNMRTRNFHNIHVLLHVLLVDR
jgi:hypothetical protein